MNDVRWLKDRVGAHLTDALMPHLDVAERDRLIRTYGYPKDDAWPPALAERLDDPAFVRSLIESIDANEDASTETLRDAVRRLLHGADGA